MARARNKAVVSQRDVRQTSNLIRRVTQPHTHCTVCTGSGQQYRCLQEFSASPTSECDTDLFPTKSDFRNYGETWSPSSGPCLEDCLKATFDRQTSWQVQEYDEYIFNTQRQRLLQSQEHDGNVRDIQRQRLLQSQEHDGNIYNVQKHRSLQSQEHDGNVQHHNLQTQRHRHSEAIRVFLAYSWTLLRGWLQAVTQNWPSGSVKTHVDRWQDVDYEAEGFLEVRIVLTRQGAIQHMEIDFPTDVTVSVLKQELATLIDVPPGAQLWYYRAQEMDETKTLDELNVDIGAMIEVRCTD